MRDSDRPPVLAHLRFAAARESFSGLDLRQRFEQIHRTNLWGAEHSVSGLGSQDDATQELARALPRLLDDLGVATLLDAVAFIGIAFALYFTFANPFVSAFQTAAAAAH